MPTYGGPETVSKHPPNALASTLRDKISDLKIEMAPLELRLAQIQAGCNHHFVPTPDALKVLQPSLVGGAYLAGELVAWAPGATSRRECLFICNCCGLLHDTPPTKRCPLCAMEVRGKFIQRVDAEPYLGDTLLGGQHAWLGKCSDCSFHVIGIATEI